MRAKMHVWAAAAVCALFAAPYVGTAAVNNWTNPASSSWGTAANWDGGIPVDSDDISIAEAGTYTVTVDNNTADNDLGTVVTSITVGASSGLPELVVDFTNAAKALVVGGQDVGTLGVGTVAGTHGRLSVVTGDLKVARMYVGSGGAGRVGEVNISGGLVDIREKAYSPVDHWLRLGFSAGSTGTLVMTGGELRNNNTFLGTTYGTYGIIGGSGKGTMIISNGVVTPGGYGLHVGASASGEGTLALHGGAVNNTNGFFQVGVASGSQGHVLIDGGTMTITNARHLNVGVAGRGLLTVSNGVLNARKGYLQFGTGTKGYGQMDIVGGTVLQGNGGTSFRIGTGASATGVVNLVSGYFSVNAGFTYMGNLANTRATLNVFGGVCEISSPLMGDGAGSWCEINVTNGSCTASSITYVRSGRIYVSGGAYTGSTTYVYAQNVVNTGMLSVAGGTVNLGSTTVGDGAGRLGYLAVEGDSATVTLSSLTASSTESNLRFDLNATGVSPVTVTGALTVSADTKLVVDASNYDTSNGGSVVLIDYGSKSGTIAEANITITGSKGSIDQTTDNKVTLVIPPASGTVVVVR